MTYRQFRMHRAWSFAVAALFVLQIVFSAVTPEFITGIRIQFPAFSPGSEQLSSQTNSVTLPTEQIPDPVNTVSSEEPLFLAKGSSLYRSTDFYDESTTPTWAEITGSITGNINDLVFSPYDPYEEAWVATTEGLWQTTDLSASQPEWTKKEFNDLDSNKSASRILFLPGDRILVTSSGSYDSAHSYSHVVYYSDDNGSNWTADYIEPKWCCSTGQKYWHRIDTAITLLPSGTLLAIAHAHRTIGQQNDALLKSEDRGETWQRVDGWETGTGPITAVDLYIVDNKLIVQDGDNLQWSDLDNCLAGACSFTSYTTDPDVSWYKTNHTSIEDWDKTVPYHIARYDNPNALSGDDSLDLRVYTIEGDSLTLQFTGDLEAEGHVADERVSSNLLVWPDQQTLALVVRDSSTSLPNPMPRTIVRATKQADGTYAWTDATGSWKNDIGAWDSGQALIRSPGLTPPPPPPLHQLIGAGGNCMCDNRNEGTQTYVGNPINTRTGNNTYSMTDLSLPTPGGALSFQRSYSTFMAHDMAEGLRSDAVQSLSPGWVHNFDVQLTFPTTAGTPDVLLQTPDGSQLGFSDPDGDDVYTPEPGAGGTFEHDTTAGRYIYTNPNGAGYTFYDSSNATLEGRVDEQFNGAGYVFQMEYTGDQLTKVKALDRSGNVIRYLKFVYTSIGLDQTELLVQVIDSAEDTTDPNARYVEFRYERLAAEEYNLIEVRDVRGNYWYYDYVDASNNSPEITSLATIDYVAHYLQSRFQATGTQLADGTTGQIDTASTAYTSFLASSDRLVRYVYDDDAVYYHLDETHTYVRAIREEDGNTDVRVTLDYISTGAEVNYGNITDFKMTLPYDASWMSQGKKTAIGESRAVYRDVNSRDFVNVDANDNTAVMDWSGDGDVLESITPANGQTSSLTYDANNNPTSLTLPDNSETRIVYNGADAALPAGITSTYYSSVPWDPDTGDSFVPSPRLKLLTVADYGGENLITEYKYSYLDTTVASDDPGKYVPPNLLLEVLHPDDSKTCYEYDSLGQVTEVITDCGNTDEKPSTTTYDAFGRPETVTDHLGRVTLYIYEDGDRRPDMVVSNYYDDDGDATLTADDYYQAFDIDGDTQSDGLFNIASKTITDDSGRVIVTIQNYWDPNGDGTLTATEIENNLVNYNHITRTYYDAAGQPEYVVTNFVGDITSSTVPSFDETTPNQNIVTRRIYDSAGRVVATITNYTEADLGGAGNGSPEAMDFDGDGITDATLEVSPDYPDLNRITTTAYNSTGQVMTVTQNAWPSKDAYERVGGTVYNRTTAYEYDAVGNVTKTVVNFDPAATPQAGDIPIWLDPAATGPEWMRMDATITDRNQMTCTEYDEMNRPTFTRQACRLPSAMHYDTGGPWTDFADYMDDLRALTLSDWVVVDYDSLGNNVYNLVSRTLYDEVGRSYATISNYYDPDEDGSLTLTTEYNHVTRRYYDGLGRMIYSVSNFNGDLTAEPNGSPSIDLGTLYDPLQPDQNLVTRYFYNGDGQRYATIQNYYTGTLPVSGATPAITDIDGDGTDELTTSDDIAIAAADPDLNIITLTTFDAEGRPEITTYNAWPGQVDYYLDVYNRLTRTFYDAEGRAYATVNNYDDDPATALTSSEISSGLVNGYNHVTRTFYDDTGRVTHTIQNYVGDLTTASLPSGGSLTNEQNLITAYVYDVMNRRQQVIDPLGNVSYSAFDERGRVTTSTIGYGTGDATSSTTDYNVAGWVIEQANGAGNSVEMDYDARGLRLTTTTDPDGAGALPPLDADSAYDAMGRVIETTDAEGIETAYVYNNLGWLIYRVDASTHGALANLPASCLPDSPNTAVTSDLCTTFTYNLAGNITSRVLGNSSKVTYQYDARGRMLTETIVSVEMPSVEGVRTDFAYNAAGNRISVTRDQGGADEAITTYTYDARGQLLTINYPSTTPDVTYTYDVEGNRVTMDDGTVWHYTYDEASRLTTVCDDYNTGTSTCNSQPIEYTYDANGNRTSLRYFDNPFADVPGSLPATFEAHIAAFYDAGITNGKGQCDDGTTPGPGETLYCPDDVVTRDTMAVFILRAKAYPNLPYTPTGDPNDPFTDVPSGLTAPFMEDWVEDFYTQGITGGCNGGTPYVDLQYCPQDPVNRGAMTVFILRALGVTPVDDPSDPFADVPGSMPPSFEAFIETAYNMGITSGKGQCDDGTTPGPGETLFCPEDSVTRGEMAVFLNRAFDIPLGEVRYTYDAANRLDTVSDPFTGGDTNGYLDYDYDAAGRVETLTRANGLVTTYGYDQASRLNSVTTDNGTSTLTDFDYTLDGRGYRTDSTETLNGSTDTWLYTYDGAGRLTQACIEAGTPNGTCDAGEETWAYTYDGAGNILTMDRWDGTSTVETSHYVYNNLNQIACEETGTPDSDCEDPTDTVYSYDAYGNLTDDGTSQYTYDDAMRLIQLDSGGVTTTYAYNGDGDRISQTVGGVTTTYTLDVAVPLTQVLAETTGTETITYLYGLGMVAQSDGTSAEYLLKDALGSVRAVADSAGTIQLTQTYDPYGNPYASSGTATSTFGFAGEQTDASGLIYLRARYYNPATGRFLTMDPSRQELNPYWYATANPVMNTDPTGLCVGVNSIFGTLTGTSHTNLFRECRENINRYRNSVQNSDKKPTDYLNAANNNLNPGGITYRNTIENTSNFFNTWNRYIGASTTIPRSWLEQQGYEDTTSYYRGDDGSRRWGPIAQDAGGLGVTITGVAATIVGAGQGIAAACNNVFDDIARGFSYPTTGSPTYPSGYIYTSHGNWPTSSLNTSLGTKPHSVYNDGTIVFRHQRPSRLSPSPLPEAESAHTTLRWDTANNRIYQARTFDNNGNRILDIDFTTPTYPNGYPRPGHPGPPHIHPYTVNNPSVGAKSGVKRSKHPLPMEQLWNILGIE